MLNLRKDGGTVRSAAEGSIISREEVCKSLKLSKMGKAPGADEI